MRNLDKREEIIKKIAARLPGEELEKLGICWAIMDGDLYSTALDNWIARNQNELTEDEINQIKKA